MSNSFTWEELPNRDHDTGYVTKAGYIPIIQRLTKYVTTLSVVYHAIQSTVRIVMSHDMVFTTWCPFDATTSPLYELANVIQVL
jgi:hypothetical protein